MDTLDAMKDARDRYNKEQGVKIHGKVSKRAELLVCRCYLVGYLKKPLESVTDVDFLTIPGFGQKTLSEVRKVIPAPVG